MRRRLAGLVVVMSLAISSASSSPALPHADRQLHQLERESLVLADDHAAFLDAGRSAWAFVERAYQPATGFFNGASSYPYTTTWDLGSGIAALYTGHALKFLDDDTYHRRMRQMLETLRTIKLFDGAGFNKEYSARTGAMVTRDGRPSARGIGWSVTDIGRLLIWLKIVAAREPEHKEAAAAVAGRLAFDRMVRDGYLWAQDVDGRGRLRSYQEGQIGYEQYAASGFALWGHRAEKALRLRENGLPISVMGRTLLADYRGRDRLTSDPIVLMGLELGWDPEMAWLARELLAVQKERARLTGRITLVGEDAIDRPPYFFYYYCAYTAGRTFGIDVQDPRAAVDGPRWVSTKAAFAWHALLPSAYTERALAAVAAARTPNGWGSGVYEADGRSTGTLNINTAAVILTSALVGVQGGPLLPAPDAPPAVP